MWSGPSAAPSTTATARSAVGALAAAIGAETAGVSVTGSLDAVEETTLRSLDVVEWIPVPSPLAGREESQTDRLSLCVGTVVLADGGSGIAEPVVSDVGDAL